MALARLHTTDMENGDIIDGDDLKDELDQLVNALNGTNNIDIIIKQSHATLPPLLLNQLGAGPIQRWQQNSGNVALLNNVGQFESLLSTGTAPFIVASATKVNNLNADLLDGLTSADFAQLASDRTRFSVSWFYTILPAAVESIESQGRFVVPNGTSMFIEDITSVWADGADSAASNVFTIKKRNAAGTVGTDVGTVDVNSGAQNVLNVSDPTDYALTVGDQIYPLLTTRNGATETKVTISVRGYQKIKTT